MRYVVLLPSVRRDRGLDGYVEGEGMRVIARLVRESLLELRGYEVEMFWPGFEQGGDLPMLRKQYQQAEMWLRACPGAHAQKIVLELCSHGGKQPSVTGICSAHGPGRRASHSLASTVAREVGLAMRTRDVRVGPRSASRKGPREEIYGSQPFISALVECGSHTHARQARLLSDSPQVVADAVVLGIRRYYAGQNAQATRPGVVWRPGTLEVVAPGVIARAAPSRAGRVLRPLGPAVLVTDGYTEGGQSVAGSSRWYHLGRECGYGWVHSSAGRYVEVDGEQL
ncbi:MAG: hypothetical protein M3Q29_11435 [Chloroflexota bacterium]|nr:hypothetical protein [Chloroflexota bacterium]